jgi:hypothetical protein
MDIFGFVHHLLDLFREGFEKEFKLFVIAELATDIIFPIGQIHRRQVFVYSGTIKFYIGSAESESGSKLTLFQDFLKGCLDLFQKSINGSLTR